jgi:hypothetical protein
MGAPRPASTETVAQYARPQDDAFPFNDDLLLDERDREAARLFYPNIYPALDFPELRALFLPADAQANAAKRRSRRWGFVAIGLVSASLIAAADENFYQMKGPLGPVIGVLFAGSKRRWLEGRLLTERLRQLHFQLLVTRAPQILAAARDNAWDEYRAERRLVLGGFAIDVAERAGPLMDELVEGEEAENENSAAAWLTRGDWLDDLTGKPHADEFFRAYRSIRLQRQIDYCRQKLRSDHRLFSTAPREQAARLENITAVCVLALLVTHAIFLASLWSHVETGLFHMIIIFLAIMALALRTLEEGLQPKREVERYRAYRATLVSIGGRFDAAANAEGRHEAMKQLEVLSFTEMISFLKYNNEARFVM